MLERSFSVLHLEYRPYGPRLPRRAGGLFLTFAAFFVAGLLLLPGSPSTSKPRSDASSISFSAPQPAENLPAPQATIPDSVNRWADEGIVFVMRDQEWDASSLAVVDAALALLPPEIRSRLGNSSLGPLYLTVNRAGRTPAGAQPYSGPANFYSTNDGRNDLVLFPGQSLLTVLHELGHAYNLRRVPAASYALVLLEPEMRSFMDAAGWRVLTPHDELRVMRDQSQVAYAYDGETVWSGMSRVDPLEDFANSFALYYGSRESLRQLSQARFEWFERFAGR